LGGDVVAVTCDVTKDDEVRQMVDTAVARFGRLDILVNNAGVSTQNVPIAELSEDAWDQTLGVNLKGTFLCTRAAIPKLLEHGDGGRIINGKPGREDRLVAAGCVLRLNSIPGGLWDSYSRLMGTTWEEVKAQTLTQIPLGRFQEPDDVADLIIFLASEQSGYITGEALNTTGGQELD
jgi:NAD(P)-dependent dehydrogenase (short-subunit alcohol dehydrogenase family)